MRKSPEQAIFDEIFKTSIRLGYDTYDYLPAEEVSYPFVYVGEVTQQDRHTKTSLFGDVTVTLHAFHFHQNRSELTNVINRIKSYLYTVDRADHFHVRLNRADSQFMIDDTTPDILLHGIIDLDFTFH